MQPVIRSRPGFATHVRAREVPARIAVEAVRKGDRHANRARSHADGLRQRAEGEGAVRLDIAPAAVRGAHAVVEHHAAGGDGRPVGQPHRARDRMQVAAATACHCQQADAHHPRDGQPTALGSIGGNGHGASMGYGRDSTRPSVRTSVSFRLPSIGIV